MADFDSILQNIGEFGKYQKLLYFACLCLAVTVPGAFNNMTIVFLAAQPAHWCRIPSSAHLDLSQDALLKLTIPVETRDGEEAFSQCRQYDADYSRWTAENVSAMLKSGHPAGVQLAYCNHGWQYDTSVYHSTIVTQVGQGRCGGCRVRDLRPPPKLTPHYYKFRSIIICMDPKKPAGVSQGLGRANWGPLTGGPQCRMSILRNGNVAYLWPCHMSILRIRPVACHYIFKALSHVDKLHVTCRI